MNSREAPPNPAPAKAASTAKAAPAPAAPSAAKAAPAAAARPRSRAKRTLWGIGLFVVAVAAAYGAGYFQMRTQLVAKDEQLTQVTRALETAERAKASQQRQVNELEARRKIHLAINEFDQNNFGTAEEHLRAAAALLEASSPGDAPVEPGLLSLAQSLRTLELAPTLDLIAQRTALLGMAAKFDNLRPTPAR